MSTLPTLDTTYPALIIKASRRTIHHGALGVARSLGRLGVPVYAVVEDSHTPLARSRYLTKAFVWKCWPEDRAAFLNAMSTIGETIRRPTILIPIDDLSAIIVAENAEALSPWFLLPEMPGSLPRQLANKANFYSLCGRIELPRAKSVMPRSVDDIREFINNTSFPIVAKATEQWRLLNGRFNVKIIQSPEALFDFCKQVENQKTSGMILQEYVPGKDWIFHGYCNAKANLYVSFTGQKLLDYPPGAGSTAMGVSCRNEVLSSQIEGFLRAISYSGIVDIDCRQDFRDGQYKIMDCNPRVGMNFRMFENDAGIDVVRALHLNLTGRDVTCAEMIEGRLFIVESYYLLSSIRSGRSALKAEAGKPPGGNVELGWWSSDDIVPVIVMILRLFFQTAVNALRHVWH
jgi:D-aspartate ligase